MPKETKKFLEEYKRKWCARRVQ